MAAYSVRAIRVGSCLHTSAVRSAQCERSFRLRASKMRKNLNRTLDQLEHERALIHSNRGVFQITESGMRDVEHRKLHEVQQIVTPPPRPFACASRSTRRAQPCFFPSPPAGEGGPERSEGPGEGALLRRSCRLIRHAASAARHLLPQGSRNGVSPSAPRMRSEDFGKRKSRRRELKPNKGGHHVCKHPGVN